jgi:phosphoribosylformimino-5-aminoimidazole carboxamide ribotide isomerase
MIIPSIDIEGGRAVKRVLGKRGEYVYVGDPLALAERFKKAPFVHVVDLDGAEAGTPVNVSVVEKVAEILGGRCQLGGGLRSEEAVKWALSICQVAVVGTMPFKQPELFRVVAAKYGSRLAASLDIRRGRVAVEGWREASAPVEEALEVSRPPRGPHSHGGRHRRHRRGLQTGRRYDLPQGGGRKSLLRWRSEDLRRRRSSPKGGL